MLLAPMEDVTDPSFRLICKEQGADMVYTEFVSADALVRNINSTTRKLHTNAAERPVAIQIYGKEVEPMVEAANRRGSRSRRHRHQFRMSGEEGGVERRGAGMLRDVPKLLQITRSVVDAVKLPVTVKTRLGWDCENKSSPRSPSSCRTAASVRLQSTDAPAARCIPATPTGRLSAR